VLWLYKILLESGSKAQIMEANTPIGNFVLEGNAEAVLKLQNLKEAIEDHFPLPLGCLSCVTITTTISELINIVCSSLPKANPREPDKNHRDR